MILQYFKTDNINYSTKAGILHKFNKNNCKDNWVYLPK